MARVRLVRFAAIAVSAFALSAAVATHPVTPPRSVDAKAAATTTPPTNAGKIFRWGNAQFNDEFVTPLHSMWAVNKPGTVRDQHGMLTLDATSGTVTATVKGHLHQYGRWEARVRTRQYGTGATPYRALWELVPSGAEHCGARNIILSDYTLGTNRAAMHFRNLPDVEYSTTKALPLNNVFHTYAVEVTPNHISWFVDTKVIRTERRASARTGTKYTIRFRLYGPAHAKMNKGRMQMDWVRYYTMARKNAKPITAPQTTRGTYASAC
jgi:hypothetical protein